LFVANRAAVPAGHQRRMIWAIYGLVGSPGLASWGSAVGVAPTAAYFRPFASLRGIVDHVRNAVSPGSWREPF
jgi:hypothetical protein